MGLESWKTSRPAELGLFAPCMGLERINLAVLDINL